MTRTDYDSPGFARKFAASRPLDGQAIESWGRLLRSVAGESVHTVLDLGAGTGRFWPVILDAWPDARIIAVDSSATMLAEAPSDSRVLRTHRDLDSLTPDFCDPDVVFCSMAIHYSADPAALSAVIRSMLGPAGTFIVRTSTRETAASSAVFLFFPRAREAQLRAFPERAAIEGWLRGAGFRTSVESVSTPAAPSYRALVGRCLRRGLPALQLVPTAEFIGGSIRLVVWAFLQWARHRPIPTDETIVLVGR